MSMTTIHLTESASTLSLGTTISVEAWFCMHPGWLQL